MAKDLPYFKFFCSEWSDGDITLETYETQGLFVNICAYYWSNECVLELSKLKKRFRNDAGLVDLLIDNNLIKVNNAYVIINFLNEQKIEREEQSKVKSKGGLASAEAKRLAKLQQTHNTTSTENQHVLKYCSTESQVLRKEEIREEEIREDNNIDSRKLKFAHTLKPFLNLYDKEVIRNFYEYWTEPNKSNTKYRQELQKTWSTERRLKTWTENNFNNNNKNINNEQLTGITTAIRDFSPNK